MLAKVKIKEKAIKANIRQLEEVKDPDTESDIILDFDGSRISSSSFQDDSNLSQLESPHNTKELENHYIA